MHPQPGPAGGAVVTGAESALITDAVSQLLSALGGIAIGGFAIGFLAVCVGSLFVGTVIDRVCQCIEQVGRGR